MKKFFIILLGIIVVTAMVGCLNLTAIPPFLNSAPVMISEPIITATEDQLYLYQVEASDPNGDTLIYSFIIKPEGMSIDNESGLISWTPANNQVGIHQVVVEISDGKHSVSQRFKIEVFNVNNPPQIFSYFPANLNFEINEGSSIKFEVQTNDIDLNTTLSFQWFLNGKLVLDSTVSRDGSKSSWIYSASYGDYGQKIVKVLVSDGELQDYVQWNITINDITLPAQPTLNTVTSPTNIPTQTLSGNKESNTSIWVNGAEVISINSDTTWSHPYSLSEGTNNISITSRDTVGNESSAVTAIIILDTINPAAPTLDATVSPTNISPQTLSGSKEANTSVWINNLEVVPINSSTTWTYDFNLSEGENNISINSRDAVSNESAVVNNSITLDTIPPTTPTLYDIISPTNICIQLLSGNKEINSSIWVNGVEVISVNSKTTWSYDFELIEGENSISIISKDIVGNESNEINTTVILDISAPAIPSLEPVSSPTNISSQTLSGTKEANTSIWINGTEVVPLNSSTDWSYSYNLSEGNNNISVTSRDAAGNESSAVTATIEYDPNIYVDAANATGIEDGTKTHPFNTVTEGIIAVSPGKSVIVATGTYYEQLIINKSITLQGVSQDNTFISGSGLTGNLITIEADNITITGFTIDGSGSTSIGLYFDSYSFVNINNNIIQNNSSYGINYSNSSPTIENNNIKNNNYSGIDVGTGGAGIIRNNFVVSSKHGIRTYGDSCPEINGNNISNNNTGIYCRESATPIISYNTISNNSGYGILIDNILGNLVDPDIGGGEGGSAGKNNITGNYIHGVSNKTTHSIMALNNWWGDAAGPKYPGNNSSSGDWAYWDNVNNKAGAIKFDPYLKEPQTL
ncbi:hypothetical protein ES704_00004 [subsurface metagenome]|jgi:parallel beta-helix repeat protein